MAPVDRNPAFDRELTLQFVRQLYEDSFARYGKDHEQTLLLFKYVHASEAGPKTTGSTHRTLEFPMTALSGRVSEANGKPTLPST
jgi:hypothetical protein